MTFLRSSGGEPTPVMEEANQHLPPAEVSSDNGWKIPRVEPGQPRVDPRDAMRPSDLPSSRSPPKTYKDGGKAKKRKRDPSHQSRSSEHSSEHRTAEAEVGNHSTWRGANRGLRGVRMGRGGGRQLPPPARCEEPSGSNNRGGKKSKARKRKPKGGQAPQGTQPGNSLPVINGQQMVPLAQVQAMITTAVANVFSQLIQ